MWSGSSLPRHSKCGPGCIGVWHTHTHTHTHAHVRTHRFSKNELKMDRHPEMLTSGKSSGMIRLTQAHSIPQRSAFQDAYPSSTRFWKSGECAHMRVRGCGCGCATLQCSVGVAAAAAVGMGWGPRAQQSSQPPRDTEERTPPASPRTCDTLRRALCARMMYAGP